MSATKNKGQALSPVSLDMDAGTIDCPHPLRQAVRKDQQEAGDERSCLSPFQKWLTSSLIPTVFQKEVYLHTSPHLRAEPDPTAKMAAESLPFSFGTLSSWELEAWYEDLQEVLSSDENGGTYVSLPGNKEEESKTVTTLDPASLAWLTEPGPAEVTNTSQSPRSPDSSQSSLAQEEEEEDQRRPRKRKPSGQSSAGAGKQRMKEKEQENERKVARLAEENERLKQEIERLTREVEATRRALIDRMVNLHQA